MKPRSILNRKTIEYPETFEYPETDGQPMAESDEHRDEMKDYAIDVLRDHFSSDLDVYVSGNNIIYYTEEVPSDCVSPDTYVVKGRPARPRRVYRVWEEEGQVPCFVLELTSKSSRRQDAGDKLVRYRDELGVAEYFIFDLHADWVKERLRGYELRGGGYEPIRPGPSGRLSSRQLGLELAVVAGHLRFFVPDAVHPLPTRPERVREERQRADEERQRADEERRRAEHAETEVSRLRSELERLRGREER